MAFIWHPLQNMSKLFNPLPTRVSNSCSPLENRGGGSGVGCSWSQVPSGTSTSGLGYSHSCTRDNIRRLLLWLRTNRTGLSLTGPKSSCQIQVNVALLLDIEVPESAREPRRDFKASFCCGDTDFNRTEGWNTWFIWSSLSPVGLLRSIHAKGGGIHEAWATFKCAP